MRLAGWDRIAPARDSRLLADRLRDHPLGTPPIEVRFDGVFSRLGADSTLRDRKDDLVRHRVTPLADVDFVKTARSLEHEVVGRRPHRPHIVGLVESEGAS